MTDHPTGSGSTPEGEARDAVQRPASVQLREGSEQADHAALMDPANQSLAEALRITYRLLQSAMVVLFVLYLGSGFQSIKTNERGVRLLFGKVVAQDLKPGFHFAWPYPIGEMVKVDVGNQDLKIDRAFWPETGTGARVKSVDDLRASASLSPDQDGSILTGDGAIAHTQWKVQYARTDASAFARDVYPGPEAGIITAAVQRGAVQAIAGVKIDDLLKQSSSDAGSVTLRAKVIAQEMLRGIGNTKTGIEIEQLSLDQKIPPAYLREKFNSVIVATSNASRAREDAQKEGNMLLSETAGGSASILISLIDQYERQIDTDETEQAAATLAQIDRVFDGLPITVDGVEINPSVGGRVSAMLSEARQYRSGVVDRARSDLAVFRAKLEQFKTNPRVMITTDWTDSMSRFFADDRVEIFFNPAGIDTLELVINSDPEIAGRREREMLEKQNEAALDKREELMERSRYETEEGLRLVPN